MAPWETPARPDRSVRWATTAAFVHVSIPVCVLFLPPVTAADGEPRLTLSFEERVAAQEAIERVYDRHRMWPRSTPKLPLESRVPRQLIERKVRDDLRKRVVLEQRWQEYVSVEQVNAELARMARDTKDPAMLRELFAALGNDAVLLGECLARPRLVDCRVRGRFAPDASLHKERFDSWWERTRDHTAALVPAIPDGYRVPSPGGFSSTRAASGDVWLERSSLAVPSPRCGHTAVWTGTEMIVWGGISYLGIELGSGSRYDPITDTWSVVSSGPGCPSARSGHTAVWTGSTMIVWGNGSSVAADSSGGSYDPLTDTWQPTSTGAGCPSSRINHTAVWTGREMIVWGGLEGGTTSARTGARYDSMTDTWTPTSVGASCPAPRWQHTAVWVGSNMLVWGGLDAGASVGDGARYDPTSDSWQPMSNVGAPAARWTHFAVGTGTEMIVWGGVSSPGAFLNSGGRYDLATDSWSPTSTVACPTARQSPTGVWTGTELNVWGGFDGAASKTGGRYDPVSDSWLPLSTGAGNPSARFTHTAVWTGNEMVVWGGRTATTGFVLLNDGGRYRPATDSWSPTTTGGCPPALEGGTLVWTGAEAIAWGGEQTDTGGRYDPALDVWTPTSTLMAPSPRDSHEAIWTGTEMIVWGGRDGGLANTGARYEPVGDAWTATSTLAAPTGRGEHTLVWTGDILIVWGGVAGGGPLTATGGRYDPASDSWLPTSITGAPQARANHSAVWTGTQMIVWGGAGGGTTPLRSGGRYDPAADVWLPTTVVGSASPRLLHGAVWTGTEMIVWGGGVATGGRYDPATNTWSPTSTGTGCPSARWSPGAVWTGAEMIVWGGLDASQFSPLNTGGRYAPSSDSWRPTSVGRGCPPPRPAESAVWTGSGMLVWAGIEDGMGGIYIPARTSGRVDFVTGTGLGPPNPNRVRVATGAGVLTSVDFVAYGAGAWGVNVATGDLHGTGSDRILTGPGPGPTLGPQVRGWDDAVPISKVNFYAFGTPRSGVNVTAGDLDVDAYAEIGAGAGPGTVFGPHVRGFAFDAATVQPIVGINYFAYQTLQYGVHTAFGDVDGDGLVEIVTGAGPGVVFTPHVRGFNHDGAPVAPLPRLSFQAFPVTQYGANVASASVDGDGYAEIAASLGPGPALPSSLRGFDYDALAAKALPGFDVTPFATTFGSRVGLGDVSSDGTGDLIAGAGRDPAADATVRALEYDGTMLTPLSSAFLPYFTTYGVNVTTGALGY